MGLWQLDTPLTRQSHRLASCGRLRIPPQEERTYIASCRGVRIPPQEEGDLINHRVWAFTTWWRRTPQHQSLSLSYLSLSVSFFLSLQISWFTKRTWWTESLERCQIFFFLEKREIFLVPNKKKGTLLFQLFKYCTFWPEKRLKEIVSQDYSTPSVFFFKYHPHHRLFRMRFLFSRKDTYSLIIIIIIIIYYLFTI